MTDQTSLAAQLLDTARTRGLMIVTAESCTGGLVAGALTDIPGSSDVFERGLVTYSNAAKAELLGVSPATIDTRGAVSEQTVREMAQGALTHAPAQLSVAISGVAGPGGTEQKPEGLVWFATALTGHATETLEKRFGPIGRQRVREQSVITALTLALGRLI